MAEENNNTENKVPETENKQSLEALPAAELIKIIKELREENAKHRIAKKDVYQELEALKKAEQERLEAEQMKKGEYEKIIEQLKTKIKEYENYKKELNVYKEREQKELQQLKAKLPDELQQVFANNNNLEELRAIVELQEKMKVPNSPGSENLQNVGLPSDPLQMTEEQLQQFAIQNPEAYTKFAMENYDRLVQ